jgi:E3 ubiquitin-protein ligase TRIP12
MDFDEEITFKDLSIKIHCKDNELTDEMLIGDVVTSSSTMPILTFSFDTVDYKCQYFNFDSQIYEDFMKKCSLVGLELENPSYPYLRFLKLLFLTYNSYPLTTNKFQFYLNPSILNSFISPKLNAVISKHFQEPLSLSRRVLPSWMKELPKHSWFLFTYMTRLKILDNVRFIHNETYRLPRQKVKINREKILDSAYLIMNDLGLLQHGILEIQYDNEVGTGNGPTLEFFTLLSEEIKTLNIWRKSTILYPSPHQVSNNNIFHFIGRVIGKAILDKRYIELPLSPVFWKLIQNQPVCLNDLADIDSVLHKTFKELKDFVRESHQDKHAKYKY